MSTAGAIFQTMRPKQWTKNLLLFAGLVFSHSMTQPGRIASAFWGFVVFCGLSGIVYIVNDIKDLQSDRSHPLKCQRPIASGLLGVRTAWFAAIIGGLLCLSLAFSLNLRFGLISTAYFLMMLLYSFTLKHVVILDLMIVAMGFVVRAIAGVYAIEVPGDTPIPITPWFISCILFLALFIAICKRRHELLLLAGNAAQHRPVLDQYSQAFLDQMVSVATAATVISYALYVTLGVQKETTPHHEYMIWTLPFVLYGIFRYLYLVYKRDEGGSPEVLLLQDPSMLINICLWLVTIALILYA